MADFPLALEYCKVTRHRACFQWAHLTAFHVQKGKAVASLFCVTLSGLSLPLGDIRVGGTLEVTSHHRCFPGCLLAEPCLMGLCGWMPDALGGGAVLKWEAGIESSSLLSVLQEIPDPSGESRCDFGGPGVHDQRQPE